MKLIIAGAGEMGKHLAKLFTNEDHDCTIIDDSAERLDAIDNDSDVMIVHGSPTSIATLQEQGIKDTDLFISVMHREDTNISACVLAKGLGAKKVVARISSYEYLKAKKDNLFPSIGIDSLIYPDLLAAKDIVQSMKMSWVRQRINVFEGQLVLLGIKLRKPAPILGKQLKDISDPNDQFHIVAIKRAGETIIPGGLDTIENQDLVFFMTTKEFIPQIRKIVGKEHYTDVRNVMIMGGDRSAVRAALTAPDYMKIKIIEKDEKRCEIINELIDRDNVLVIHGDGRNMSLLREENIYNTQAFVALTGNAETNILACLAAKRVGVRKTIAQVENMDYVGMAESLDIGTIINKKVIAASHIYQMMLDENVANLQFLMSANADVAEFIAADGAKVTRKLVKDLGLPRGVTIGGLLRDGKAMLVSGMTQIQPGDTVMVFAHNVNLRKIEKLFKKETIIQSIFK